MTQYVIFLAAFPLALFGTVLANLLSRILHTYHRFAWLRFYNYLQLGFLLCNLTELLSRNPVIKQSLAAIDYLFLGLANGSDGLVWRNLRFVEVSWILGMRTSGYGPVALATISQSYAITLLGAFILLQHSISTHKIFRQQTAWMLAGVLLTLATNLCFILRVIPGWNKDYSSLTAALGGLCFSIGCLRHRLLTVVPVSRQTQFQYMRLGLIAVDTEGLIIVRRECLDNFLVVNEKQATNLVFEYVDYYNHLRPHQGIGQDVPQGYEAEPCGNTRVAPILGGLHHHYYRKAS